MKVQITTCEAAFLTSKKLSAWEMAHWKSKTNNSSATASELCRCISVAADYIEK